MSNRFLSILILASFVLLGVAAYLYFFVYHVVVVTIQNNVPNYTVILESKNTFEKQTITCPKTLCVIPNVPPFEYTLGIEKDGYNSQIFTKHITTSTTLDIALQKTVHFEIIPEEPQYVQNAVLPGSDREHTTSYLFQNGNITDTIYNTSEGIDIQIPIKYIKTGFDEREFLIVTDKGTFRFDTRTGDSEYFTLFKDFIYLDDSYIGVVAPSDTRIRTNLQLSGSDTLLVQYFPDTKKHVVFHSFGFNIEKIYVHEGSIIIVDNSGESYSISSESKS